MIQIYIFYEHGNLFKNVDEDELAKEQYNSALSELTKTMENNPDNAKYPRKCGDCYKQINDYAKAREYYLKAIRWIKIMVYSQQMLIIDMEYVSKLMNMN